MFGRGTLACPLLSCETQRGYVGAASCDARNMLLFVPLPVSNLPIFETTIVQIVDRVDIVSGLPSLLRPSYEYEYDFHACAIFGQR